MNWRIIDEVGRARGVDSAVRFLQMYESDGYSLDWSSRQRGGGLKGRNVKLL